MSKPLGRQVYKQVTCKDEGIKVVKLATGSSKLIPTLLMIGAVFFIVRQPEKAATFSVGAMNGLMKVADSFATFAGHLG